MVSRSWRPLAKSEEDFAVLAVLAALAVLPALAALSALAALAALAESDELLFFSQHSTSKRRRYSTAS